jgi:intracellular sulfur oxidation DsrE/DsrF family protein
MPKENGTSRREFIERMTTSAIAIGVGSASITAEASAAVPSAKPDESWLQGVKGSHAQIFDMTQPQGGFALVKVANYLDTYKLAYDLTPPKVMAIVGLWGSTIPLGFNDAMWAKYNFSAMTNTVARGTKERVTRNPFVKTAQGTETMGLEATIDVPASSTMSALQLRGARFILCNNAFNFWVRRLSTEGAGETKAVRAELEQNMVAGVTIVPAMVIAFNRAQEEGASYAVI